jgi:hypothetical protein
MFHGSATEIPKARKAVLRRMRRNSDGSLIIAPSVDELTHEPDMDTYDPFSMGERYLWDEELIDVRKVTVRSTEAGLADRDQFLAPGILNTQTVLFFCEYHVEPTYYDRIVELALDRDGDLITPYRRRRIYRAQSVVDYRSDTGRIEFWGIFCSEKDAVLIDNDYQKK